MTETTRHAARSGPPTPTSTATAASARRVHVPPRRVLRPRHLADRQPRAQRRRLPARAAARRGVGLLLRHRQLRPRDRHRQPLRHRRPVRRAVQRRLPQGRARPRRELRDAAHPGDVPGDARRLDQRGLRPVRRPRRDRQRRSGSRMATTPTPSPASGSWPSGWSACPATRQIRTDATATRSTGCSPTSPRTSPRSTPSPASRTRWPAFNLFAYLSRSDVTWNPSVVSRVQGQPVLPDDRGVHPADHPRQRPGRVVRPALRRDPLGRGGPRHRRSRGPR